MGQYNIGVIEVLDKGVQGLCPDSGSDLLSSL